MLTFDLFLGVALGVLLARIWQKLQQVVRRSKFKEFDISDTGNQLRFVEGVRLYTQRPINKEAFRAFSELEKHLGLKKRKWRLLAEVGLGAFIRTSPDFGSDAQRQRAFNSFNSKRVDFLVIDSLGRPAAAVEYQGSGHNMRNDAAARDAVKKRALQRAGIELLEIYDYSDPKEFLPQLDAILDRHFKIKSY